MRHSCGILCLTAGVLPMLAWTIVIELYEATCPRASCASAPSQPEEMQKRDRWLRDRLLSAAGSSTATSENRAFSFVYGEQPSDRLLAAWPRTSQSSKLSKDRTQYTLTWTDAKTGLQVRCVAVTYADFPAVEWTVHFTNVGKQDTSMLANLQAIDTRIERGPGNEYLLKYNKGDTCAPDLYEPLECVLKPNAQLRLSPAGGRGTNQAFPYYNLSTPGGGLILAVGWPGQWAATFSRDAAHGLRIVAGQEVTHLVLRPGEEVRTPLVALLFWKDADTQRAQNLWRRWMIAYNLPRSADDQLPSPIMPGNTSGEFNEMCNATEKDENQFIDRYVEERIPIDYWWMDAGWYPCNGWPQTGTWEPDLKRFPKGLRAISDHARAKGIKTLVWFEPERVADGTWLAQNHPEWLLGGTLLNLGDPEARMWLTDHTDKVLREQGIDLYRQDFNMDPLEFWRRNDAPDRQGITENLHVQGYLAYWDALRQRHPSLRIDSCASGGRRNDLETLRRAVPLHPTDYNYGHLAAKQAFHQSLFQWIPYFGSNTVPCDTVDAYAIRSGHAMSVVLGYDLRRSDLDYALLRKLTKEARLVAPYYYGDYYPLTPYTLSEDAWIAWQFNQTEAGDGLVEAFRRPRSQKASISLQLRGLDAQAVYEIKNADQEAPTRATGRDLMEKGLTVSAAHRPQAALITYKCMHGLAAVISASQPMCEVHEPVTFSAAGSHGPNAEISACHWDFGDQTTGEGPSVDHAYRRPGTYAVKLAVTDRQGATDATCAAVTVTTADTTPPAIVAVASATSDKVGVVFNKPIEQTSAEKVANYAIDRGVHILSASLATDLVTVTLHTSSLSRGTTYLLTVKNIADRAQTPHTVALNSQLPFLYRGMYGWWRLDDGKGDVAVDCSGNGHHGVLQGAHGGPAWSKDARGTVLSFDGIDALVETETFFPDLAFPFSISLWVNPAPTQTVHADILGNHGEPFVGINLQQDGMRTNCFGFGFGDGRKWQGTGSTPLKAGQWQHVAVVCDGETSILYVNGLEKSKGPGKGSVAANPSQNFKLGQGYHSSRYFHGLLSDVRIYREALSPAEVAELAKTAPQNH
ncbi:MAG: LamG-like jellyroll fold domain-containing protein [Thermoguttaceae bacterium]